MALPNLNQKPWGADEEMGNMKQQISYLLGKEKDQDANVQRLSKENQELNKRLIDAEKRIKLLEEEERKKVKGSSPSTATFKAVFEENVTHQEKEGEEGNLAFPTDDEA